LTPSSDSPASFFSFPAESSKNGWVAEDSSKKKKTFVNEFLFVMFRPVALFYGILNGMPRENLPGQLAECKALLDLYASPGRPSHLELANIFPHGHPELHRS